MRERRGQRAKGVHPVHGRQRAHQANHRVGQRPRRRELRLQIAELGARGQPAMPEQVADLLEGGGLRQVVDVVPAIREHAAIAVEVTDRRGRRDDVLEPALWLVYRCGHSWSLVFRRSYYTTAERTPAATGL